MYNLKQQNRTALFWMAYSPEYVVNCFKKGHYVLPQLPCLDRRHAVISWFTRNKLQIHTRVADRETKLVLQIAYVERNSPSGSLLRRGYWEHCSTMTYLESLGSQGYPTVLN